MPGDDAEGSTAEQPDASDRRDPRSLEHEQLNELHDRRPSLDRFAVPRMNAAEKVPATGMLVFDGY